MKLKGSAAAVAAYPAASARWRGSSIRRAHRRPAGDNQRTRSSPRCPYRTPAADIRRAAASDHIEDTIDYKKVAKRLLAFVGESQFNLVETLAEQIARVIVMEFGVSWVKVRLNKQGAIRGARDVGIEIERRAQDYA